MKKLSMLLVLALIATVLAVPAFADEVVYSQSPMLDERVANGELPPVEERLPENPLVTAAGVISYAEYFTDYEIGKYGGTLKSVRNSATWDGWIWCLFKEHCLETVSWESKDYYGNIFESWDVNEDNSVYTFYMREGMKWSDGEDLTTEDVQWKFEMDHSNTELTTVWPNWIRTGNSSKGTPCTLDVIDEYTFSLSFDAPYPAFLLIAASQDAYEMLAPAHYMKDFHKDTADPDELAAKCEANGYEANQWFSLYELYDNTSWDVAAENQIGCPSISPWIITKMEGTTGVYERNPYYHKVDAAGQQLPYADYMTSTYCVDKEAIAVKILAGEVDYTYEWVPLDEIGLFAQNAVEGDFKVVTKTLLHRTGADLIMNWTYDDPNWREVVANYDFRAALCYAVNCDEIVDTVYFGFARPASDLTITEYDPAKAGELLDGIGMTIGKDGYRTYPNGDPCVIELAYSAWMTTYEPTAVLIAEYLRGIDLNVQMKFMDNDLISTMRDANELQMCIGFTSGVVEPSLPEGWQTTANACNYWLYLQNNGEAGEEPNELFKEWFLEYLPICYTMGIDKLAEGRAAQYAFFKENLLHVIPVQDITQPCVVSNRLRNFPSEGGFNIGAARGGEEVWIDETASNAK